MMEIDYVSKDVEFVALLKLMDSCAESRGGCNRCPLSRDCLKFFDRLSTRAMDGKLGASVRMEFEARFKNFSKQLSFV